MELKEIEQIINLMTQADLSGFEIKREGLELRINRENKVVAYAPAPIIEKPAQTAPQNFENEPPVAQEDKNISYIKSPIVGTFYASSSPESAPFITQGSTVNSNTVVCIIEAMKVMNEIQAEISGTITEVLVQNGQNVEFGQNLFKIRTL